MKQLYTILFLVQTFSGTSQKIEKFYDFDWKETEAKNARFYSLVEKTDSGWRRSDYFLHNSCLQMEGLYEDSACQKPAGRFAYFHPNRNIESYGDYRHGKKQGIWLKAYSDGMIADSSAYEDGHLIGTCLAWHHNGFISDSAVYNADGSGIAFSWFDNGNPSSAGRFAPGFRQDGKWAYYHKNGQLSSLELYNQGKLVEKEYFDMLGKPVKDTANKDKDALFPGGQKAWLNYLSKEIYFPDQFQITNGDHAAVVVEATIDEDGKVSEVEVVTPFYPAFDKIAALALRKSPDWIPAMQHNRRIKTVIRQPIIFSQPE